MGAIAAAATPLFISPPTVAADPIAATATVLKVVDGDTIDIRDNVRGSSTRADLGNRHTRNEEARLHRRLLGTKATEFAQSTMVGQRVALVTDPTQDRTDRYGRTLAYLVRADGWDYSVEAARAGARAVVRQ